MNELFSHKYYCCSFCEEARATYFCGAQGDAKAACKECLSKLDDENSDFFKSVRAGKIVKRGD